MKQKFSRECRHEWVRREYTEFYAVKECVKCGRMEVEANPIAVLPTRHGFYTLYSIPLSPFKSGEEARNFYVQRKRDVKELMDKVMEEHGRERKCGNCKYYVSDFCNYLGEVIPSPDMCCDRFMPKGCR
jgi:hypothetical protein